MQPLRYIVTALAIVLLTLLPYHVTPFRSRNGVCLETYAKSSVEDSRHRLPNTFVKYYYTNDDSATVLNATDFYPITFDFELYDYDDFKKGAWFFVGIYPSLVNNQTYNSSSSFISNICNNMTFYGVFRPYSSLQTITARFIYNEGFLYNVELLNTSRPLTNYYDGLFFTGFARYVFETGISMTIRRKEAPDNRTLLYYYEPDGLEYSQTEYGVFSKDEANTMVMFSSLSFGLTFDASAIKTRMPTDITRFARLDFQFTVPESLFDVSWRCPNYSLFNIEKVTIIATIVIGSVFSLFTLLMFPIYLVYRNEQPSKYQVSESNHRVVRSRLFVPYLGYLFFFVQAFPMNYDVEQYAFYASSIKIARDVKQLVASFLIIVSFSSLLVQVVRYLYMKNVYNQMGAGRASNLSIHRLFTSRKTFIACVIVLVIVASGFLIGSLLGYFYSAEEADSIVNYSNYIVAVLVFSLIAIIFISDFGFNFKEIFIQRKLFSYFGFKDPLSFRIEMALAIPSIISAASLFAVNSLLKQGLTLTNTTFSLTNATLLLLASLYIIFFVIFYFVLFNFSTQFSVLMLTIARLISRNKKKGKKGLALFIPERSPLCCVKNKSDLKEEEESEIEKFLAEEEAYQLMYSFCQHEFSLENILIWKHLKQLSEMPNGEAKFNMVMEMYEKFVKRGSDLTVNISNPAYAATTDLVAKLKQEGADKASIDMKGFESLYFDIMLNLKDTFGRFSLTDEYRFLEKKIEIEKRNSYNI